ncbi:MAG: T9SS type A sorting domain-containing protein [Dysgonamonadaceae bacterium]|nr:T9SS type A sorting domain-containing protein [Dysgonamonadaceae bacterium]
MNSETQISLNRLPAGVYLVRIQTEREITVRTILKK